MSLATRVSIAFLVALALALGGFSASLYYLAGLRLQVALDQELEAALDRFPRGDGGQVGRVTWAVVDEQGRRVGRELADTRPTPLAGLEVAPLAVDVPVVIAPADGSRWRILARRIPGRRRRGGPSGVDLAADAHRPGRYPADRVEERHRERDQDRERDRERDHPPERPGLVLAAWADLAPVEAEIRWLGAALPGLSLGLWTVAALIGRYFARRALAPLARMAESARLMGAEGAQLPCPGTRDELADFAASFNGLLDRLQIALDRQRQFTGQASHQLRTPLAALLTTIEVARRRPRTVADHERTLDRLHDDAARLTRIVEALLFLARADADAALPDLTPLDLAAWTTDHLRTWAGHERAPDLRLRVATPGAETGSPRPLVRAHGPLLGQLLDNLIENAAKSSAAGSAIVVRVEVDGQTSTLVVEDQGTGIAPDDLPRVFEPFFQAEAARRAGRVGVGLGLAVAQRIADAHGGRLTATSHPGAGSCFTLALPQASPPHPNPA